jgi:phosphoribosyl-ATP pyrophosphohydrolase/phosphoribosyl-AMP cyclohydrolase
VSTVELQWDTQPLIPVIVQDANTRQVLMTAFMNRAAYERTLQTGQAWFWSRRRQELWHKGATSGHFLDVRGLRFDCDGDAILLLVEPSGPACHTNATSCFFNEVVALPEGPTAAETARELWDVIMQRLTDRPEGSYVARLASGGLDRLAKKVGEEATEVVIAAKNQDPDELAREMADLWFHCYLLLAEAGLRPEDVWAELGRRRR